MNKVELIKVVKSEVKKSITDNIPNIINEINKNDFKTVEQLLYYYPLYINKIKVIKHDLDNIDNISILKNFSNDVNVQYSKEYKADIEKKEDKRERLIEKLARYEYTVKKIEIALEYLKEDDYYNIIPCKYFNKMKNIEILEKLHIEQSTMTRHKNRLIREVKEMLL